MPAEADASFTDPAVRVRSTGTTVLLHCTVTLLSYPYLGRNGGLYRATGDSRYWWGVPHSSAITSPQGAC